MMYGSGRRTLRFVLSAKAWGLAFICLLFCVAARAGGTPADSSKTSIQILNSDYGEYIQGEGRAVHKLMNDVKLLHGSDTLYCDSAFFYQNQNSVEAFGDVAIYQADGTKAFADYMRYTGNTKKVFMQASDNDVQLSDNKGNTLWSREINYDLVTKTGSYARGGTLQSDATIVSSRNGTYNLKTKDARFTNEVDVSDPEYHVISSDLGYNTETKIVRFFGPSVVTNDKSVLQTSNGVYDTKDRTSHFVDRASILNEAQYIEADTLDYDRKSGLGIATGNVIAIDTTQKSTLYCDQAIYNEQSRHLIAFGRPLMKTVDSSGDSRFISADTFFSAPIKTDSSLLTAQDSLQQTANQLHAAAGGTDSAAMLPFSSDTAATGINDTATVRTTDSGYLKNAPAVSGSDSLPHTDMLVYATRATDTATHRDTAQSRLVLKNQALLDSTSGSYNNAPPASDTGAPRYFIGYHHVRIFSDSLQGRCDSLYYSQQDSLIRMYHDPVLWPQTSQITGDVIYLLADSNSLRQLEVPRNAIMISRSGPEQARMFDQIQGNTIKGYFKNNQLDSLVAQPNAASIYFAKDDSGAYVGCTEAQSNSIEIVFENRKIKKIYYRREVTQKMTPMKDVMPANFRLSRFNWRENERPKTLESFLKGTSTPHEPELLLSAKRADPPEKKDAKNTTQAGKP